MVAHEEGIVRGDDIFVEHRKRHLELRRASSKADKWPLAGVARQGPVTIGERQARGVIRISSERQTKIR
jgi:hypothetical protein